MEQITKHEYLDVYRITDGVLLNVKKYKLADHYWGYYKWNNDKKLMTKLSGLKNLYRVNVDIDDEYCPLRVGDIIYNSDKIIPLTNPAEYRYEIKTTGECFSGKYKETSDYLYVIIEVMDKYLNE